MRDFGARPPRAVIISRSDKIGDSVVTLPMAGLIKRRWPQTRVIGLARRRTEAVWSNCDHVDQFVAVDDLEEAPDEAAGRLAALGADIIVHVAPKRWLGDQAKKAGIPVRIGNGRRLVHLLNCNVHPMIKRRGAALHEAQFSSLLLAPLGIETPADVQALWPVQGLRAPSPAPAVRQMLDPGRLNLILHPMAESSPAWGFANIAAFIDRLDPGRFHCLITGTAAEAALYRQYLPLDRPNVTDVGGLLDLAGLMQLIGAADAMVAASTGPLHLGASLGLPTVGLYQNRPHAAPARWAPIGPRATTLVHDPDCPTCARGAVCDCVTQISPSRVLATLEALLAAAPGEIAGATLRR